MWLECDVCFRSGTQEWSSYVLHDEVSYYRMNEAPFIAKINRESSISKDANKYVVLQHDSVWALQQ